MWEITHGWEAAQAGLYCSSIGAGSGAGTGAWWDAVTEEARSGERFTAVPQWESYDERHRGDDGDTSS